MPFQTAQRETFEESNVDINKSSYVRDLGIFPYLKTKDLNLFLVKIDYKPELKCNSFFTDERTGKKNPEMIEFKWIGFDEYPNYFGHNLTSVFDAVIPIIKNFIK